MSKVINLRDVVSNTSSNDQGLILLTHLENELRAGATISIRIDADLALSSSFLNSSIGEYLEKYGLETFKTNVKLQCSKTQFDRVAKYVDDFAKLYLAD